jgi:hypothetical protein
MRIRTLRPCLIAGRNVPAGLVLDLAEAVAAAAIKAGDAAEEVAPAPVRARMPSPYDPPAAAPADTPAKEA